MGRHDKVVRLPALRAEDSASQAQAESGAPSLNNIMLQSCGMSCSMRWGTLAYSW